MQFIIKTDFNQDIRCDVVKIGDSSVHYKTNEDDTFWQDVNGNNVKYIQVLNHRNGIV